MLLAETDIQDQLSVVYLTALATAAGFVCAQENLDRTGTDLIVRGGKLGFPQIEWQIKATKNLPEAVDGEISFPLKRRNYDLLIGESANPRLLMIYKMPSDKSEWLSCTEEQMTLKRCAYWVSLRGQPPSSNLESVTIKIPHTQILSLEVFQILMEQAERGEI